jgi:hypothetical protein
VHTDLLQSFSPSTALCQQTHHQHLSPDVVLNDETMGFNNSPVVKPWLDFMNTIWL